MQHCWKTAKDFKNSVAHTHIRTTHRGPSQQHNVRGLSQQENYADRATAACRQS
jgi:hypothetical protein